MMASAELPGRVEIGLDRVVRAVNAILNPACSVDERNAAHSLCESIKQDHHAPSYGFQLATLEMPLSVRLFGLNILEDYIRTRMVVTGAMELRDRIWGLLALVVAVRPEERRLMQEKCAMLVAQLAMRIWPQYWPDFFDRLLELVVSNPNQLGTDPNSVVRTEMGLLMARMVVDEIHPREGTVQKLIWDDTRRPELQKALSVVLPAMMERLYLLIPHCASWNPINMSQMKQFLETMIESFGSMALWVPLDRQSALRCILDLLKFAMQCSEITSSALEILGVIATRPVRPQELELIRDVFDNIIDPAQQLLGVFANEEGYEYFKKLADALVTLATTNMGHKKSPCIPQRIDEVLDLMLQLSNYPSLLVTSTVGLFWNGIAKSEKLMSHDAVINRLPALFLYSLVTLSQDKTGERRRPYNTEDFAIDDMEADIDFDALFSTHHNRTMELLRQLSSYHPDKFAGYSASAVSTFIAERPGLAQDLGPIGLRQWDALMHATDAVLKACHSKLDAGIDTDGKVAAQISILANVLCAEHPDPSKMHTETLYLWFVSLRTLAPCLGIISSPFFSPLMQRLFDLTLKFEVKPNSLQFAIRARASSTILKACYAHPSLFVPAVEYLGRLFNDVISHDDEEKSRKQRLLTEMLLTIAGCMEGSNHRTELVRLVLSPIAERITNITATVDGHRSLLQHCGLGSLVGASSSDNEMVFRKTLSDVLSLLFVIINLLKKLVMAGDIRTIINQFVPPISAFLIKMITIIHVAYDRQEYPAAMQGLWETHFGEDVMAAEIPAMEKSLDSELMVDSLDTVSNKSLRGWLYMLRVSLYMTYGQLYSLCPGIMYNDPIPMGLFEGNEVFSISQWMLLAKHLIYPIVMNVSSDQLIKSRKESLHQLIILLVEKFGSGRLETAWQNFRSITAALGNSVGSNLERESAQEALLSTATFVLLSLLFDMLCPIVERDKRSDPVIDLVQMRNRYSFTATDCSNSPLALWIMRNNDAAIKIIRLSAAMLRWKPSLTMGKVVSIVIRWLPNLMMNTIHHGVVFNDITPHLFLAISSSSLADYHPQIIALLAELYKWQLYYNYDVIDKQIANLNLPDSTIVQKLREHYLTANPPPNPKSQRNHLKTILIKPIQQQALSAVGVTSTIPRLPDRLVVLRKLKAEQSTENTNLDLSSFFDQ